MNVLKYLVIGSVCMMLTGVSAAANEAAKEPAKEREAAGVTAEPPAAPAEHDQPQSTKKGKKGGKNPLLQPSMRLTSSIPKIPSSG